MRNLQIRNLMAFIKHNPEAKASDYAKDIKESKAQLRAVNNYIESETK